MRALQGMGRWPLAREAARLRSFALLPLWPALFPLIAPQTPPPEASCPADMRLVEGVHHEYIERLCTDERAGKCWAFLPGLSLLEPRNTIINTCMDRYEWPNTQGQAPHVMMRFVDAEASCKRVGKRLCSEFEWELACEGPARQPWPYGWSQEPRRCNNGKRFRPYDESKLSGRDRAARKREVSRLYQGAPSGSFEGCESGFGVHDLVGNVEEWVATSRPEWPYRSSLKGGYWAKPWSGCRGTNESHSPQFRYYEIGFRCCQNPRPDKAAASKSARETQKPAPPMRLPTMRLPTMRLPTMRLPTMRLPTMQSKAPFQALSSRPISR